MRYIVVIVIYILLCTVSAQAYTVVLKTGKEISGTFVSESDTAIKIKDAAGLELTFKKANLDLEKMKSFPKEEIQPVAKPQ